MFINYKYKAIVIAISAITINDATDSLPLLIRYRYLCCDITSVAMLPLPPLIRYCQHCCDATTIATATAADSLLPPLLR